VEILSDQQPVGIVGEAKGREGGEGEGEKKKAEKVLSSVLLYQTKNEKCV
jgi:hypothetical protein